MVAQRNNRFSISISSFCPHIRGII